ncbi:hypothetical protein [Brucella intermedia]|uniref:hypothetical protein n=1 Tax=Brucella intermedia TaxID=94625 RepID=UPI001591EA8C|nr:hypothetical protein [Brucella intermedia]
MAEIKTGGAAFPVTFEGGSNNGDAPFFHEGMTLRDYFAAKVMAGDFANSSFGYFESDVEQTFLVKRAEFYFRVADAMIAAREGGAK